MVLSEALAVTARDRVLSITSGGDNTLSLLLEGPQGVVSIDRNAAQNHLLALKVAAARYLNYEEYLEFLGVRESRRRMALFEKLYDGLPPEAQAWWRRHPGYLQRGAIHSGRFERFTAWCARYLVPLIHSKKMVARLLSCQTIDEQRQLYRRAWDSKRWRLFFSVVSHRSILKRYARHPDMFAYAKGKSAPETYRARLERLLTSVPVRGNFFLHYGLTGTYGDALPPYLEERGYARLRTLPEGKIQIVTEDIVHYLQHTPADTFSTFNLSDVFEALSLPDTELLWREIIRTARNGAAVAYWNNLVPRSPPAHLSSYIRSDNGRAHALHAKDRVFFYGSFHVYTILK